MIDCGKSFNCEDTLIHYLIPDGAITLFPRFGLRCIDVSPISNPESNNQQALLLSHDHADACFGLDDLRYPDRLTSQPLTFQAPSRCGAHFLPYKIPSLSMPPRKPTPPSPGCSLTWSTPDTLPAEATFRLSTGIPSTHPSRLKSQSVGDWKSYRCRWNMACTFRMGKDGPICVWGFGLVPSRISVMRIGFVRRRKLRLRGVMCSYWMP